MNIEFDGNTVHLFSNGELVYALPTATVARLMEQHKAERGFSDEERRTLQFPTALAAARIKVEIVAILSARDDDETLGRAVLRHQEMVGSSIDAAMLYCESERATLRSL